MRGKLLTISAIVLIAVVMGISAVAPAMAGNHGTVPKADPPCDAIDDPVSSGDEGKADPGKDKARDKVCEP